MLAPVLRRILARIRFALLEHLDFRFRIRAVYIQRIARSKVQRDGIVHQRIGKIDLEIARRERIDNKMPRTVGNHIAIKPSNANHGSALAQENETLDSRKFSELHGIDLRGIRIERNVQHRARGNGALHVTDFHRIVTRFRSHFHKAVPVGSSPLRICNAIAQVIAWEHAHAGICRWSAVRKLNLQGNRRFGLGTAGNLPVVTARGKRKQHGD